MKSGRRSEWESHGAYEQLLGFRPQIARHFDNTQKVSNPKSLTRRRSGQRGMPCSKKVRLSKDIWSVPVLDSAWLGSRIFQEFWVADFASACLVSCFVVRLTVWGFSGSPGLPEQLPLEVRHSRHSTPAVPLAAIRSYASE